MKKCKIVWLLLLGAFIFTMGFNEPAFAQTCSWKNKIVGARRWQLVLNGAAVLDKETGLVWERSPNSGVLPWTDAISHCYTNEVGGRKGWRIPTVEELASLIDPTQSDPALPAGHPFQNVQSQPPLPAPQFFLYWSATTHAIDARLAWVVNFGNGTVGLNDKTNPGLFGACEVGMDMMVSNLVI